MGTVEPSKPSEEKSLLPEPSSSKKSGLQSVAMNVLGKTGEESMVSAKGFREEHKVGKRTVTLENIEEYPVFDLKRLKRERANVIAVKSQKAAKASSATTERVGPSVAKEESSRSLNERKEVLDHLITLREVQFVSLSNKSSKEIARILRSALALQLKYPDLFDRNTKTLDLFNLVRTITALFLFISSDKCAAVLKEIFAAGEGLSQGEFEKLSALLVFEGKTSDPLHTFLKNGIESLLEEHSVAALSVLTVLASKRELYVPLKDIFSEITRSVCNGFTLSTAAERKKAYDKALLLAQLPIGDEALGKISRDLQDDRAKPQPMDPQSVQTAYEAAKKAIASTLSRKEKGAGFIVTLAREKLHEEVGLSARLLSKIHLLGEISPEKATAAGKVIIENLEKAVEGMFYDEAHLLMEFAFLKNDKTFKAILQANPELKRRYQDIQNTFNSKKLGGTAVPEQGLPETRALSQEVGKIGGFLARIGLLSHIRPERAEQAGRVILARLDAAMAKLSEKQDLDGLKSDVDELKRRMEEIARDPILGKLLGPELKSRLYRIDTYEQRLALKSIETVAENVHSGFYVTAQESLAKAFLVAARLQKQGVQLQEIFLKGLAEAWTTIYLAFSPKELKLSDAVMNGERQEVPEGMYQSWGNLLLASIIEKEAKNKSPNFREWRERVGDAIQNFSKTCPFLVDQSELKYAVLVQPVLEKMKIAFEACQKNPPQKNWQQLIRNAKIAYEAIVNAEEDVLKQILDEYGPKFLSFVEGLFIGSQVVTEHREAFGPLVCASHLRPTYQAATSTYSLQEINDWADHCQSQAIRNTFGRLSFIKVGDGRVDGIKDLSVDGQLATAYHFWKSLVDYYTRRLCPPEMAPEEVQGKMAQIKEMVTELMTRCSVESGLGDTFGFLGMISGKTLSTSPPPVGETPYEFSVDANGNAKSKIIQYSHLQYLTEKGELVKDSAKFVTEMSVPLEGRSDVWEDVLQTEHIPSNPPLPSKSPTE